MVVYLVKVGKKVLVLEKKEFVGGGVVILECIVLGFLYNKYLIMYGMI